MTQISTAISYKYDLAHVKEDVDESLTHLAHTLTHAVGGLIVDYADGVLMVTIQGANIQLSKENGAKHDTDQ